MIIMYSGVDQGSDGFRGDACENWTMVIMAYKSLLSVLAGAKHVLDQKRG